MKKRILVWSLGIVLLVASAVMFELVREKRQNGPIDQIACMAVEAAPVAWLCEQILFRSDFSQDQITELNQLAGARFVTMLNDPDASTTALERLLELGMDINATDVRKDGWHMTALHAAAIDGDIVQIKRLLAHGADRTIRDDTGRNAADYAREIGAKHPDEKQWREIIDLLTQE